MNEPETYKPSWRKPAGVLLIMAYITIWAVIVVSQWELIGKLPILVQSVIYLIAGIIWLLPLKPLLIWIETGKFKAPMSE
ncbi:DUF2842 domain-containing protein [Sphingorhabdus arenilitoris]|uniref:DUF2842 domain-containing protein n=1 Tax=Sphingorhabdus arenilitoris TaxID=1490041 RepID=A0ABV8RG83_9SPHN